MKVYQAFQYFFLLLVLLLEVFTRGIRCRDQELLTSLEKLVFGFPPSTSKSNLPFSSLVLNVVAAHSLTVFCSMPLLFRGLFQGMPPRLLHAAVWCAAYRTNKGHGSLIFRLYLAGEPKKSPPSDTPFDCHFFANFLTVSSYSLG